MVGVDQMRSLMAEVGPTLGLAEVFEPNGADAWVLTAMDGTEITLELHDDRLWIWTEVGKVRPGDAERILPLMLQYNAQWQLVGNLRMALHGPDMIVQACDLPAAGLDVPGLAAALSGFRDVLEGWRQIAAGGEAAPGPRSPSTVAGHIRG